MNLMISCQVLFALVTALFFTSCDNRKDYFIGVNQAPTLTLVKNGVELTGNTFADSIKIGKPLSFHYIITDEEKIRIKVAQQQQTNIVDVSSESISFTGDTEGQNIVSLTAKDSFNEEAKFSINFTIFRNIAPVAVFTVKKIGDRTKKMQGFTRKL